MAWLSFVVNCGDPGTPTYSTRTGSAFTFPNTVTYTCNKGFNLIGNRRRHCLSTGHWSGVLPTCQSKPHIELYMLLLVLKKKILTLPSMTCICLVTDCGNPGTPSNGSRNGSVFTFGGTVRFQCNRGYRLSGSSNRTCEASGRWSGNKTDCKGRTVQFISDLAFVNCFPTQ